MRKITFLVLILASFSLQSCLNIIEKLTLNRNGSGTYELTYDMSSMMTGMMRDMILQNMEEEGGEDNPFANAKVDGKIELDTLIDMKDAPMTDGIDVDDMPEIMRKVKMRLKMSETQSLFTTTLTLAFNNVSEINEFYDAMSEMGDNGGGMTGLMPLNGLFKIDGNTLVRGKMTVGEQADDENMEMMKMMMSGATYKTIYEFPKKVKGFTVANGEKTDKKTITATYDLLDIMEGKVDMAGKISFK